MSKRKERLSVVYTEEDKLVIFRVLDADDKETCRATFDFDELALPIQTRIALYGLNKLLTDRTSEEKDKIVKLDAMAKVFDLLQTGEWAKERVVGAIVVGVETEALATMLKITVPEAQVALGEYSKEERAKILARKDVQTIATRLREARKATPLASLDDLLS